MHVNVRKVMWEKIYITSNGEEFLNRDIQTLKYKGNHWIMTASKLWIFAEWTLPCTKQADAWHAKWHYCNFWNQQILNMYILYIT